MTSPDSVSIGRFEALAESAPDAILTIDEHSKILSANPAVKRIFGYEPEELIGKSLTKLIPTRLRDRHEEGVERYRRTHKRNVSWTGLELPALRKDGSEVPVEISFGEFVDERGERVFSGFVRDVSERVSQRKTVIAAKAEAERALHELGRLGRIIDAPLARGTYDTMLGDLLERLRQEVEASSAALLLLADDGKELFMRASVGLPAHLANLRVPLGTGIAGRVAQSGEPLVEGDLRSRPISAVALDASVISVAAVPIPEDGNPIGVIMVGSPLAGHFDMTDVRLLQLVAERTAGVFLRTRLYGEVERRREQAEAAVKARDYVLSIVSHDLKNPVSTIVMSASLLADPEIPMSDEQRKAQYGVIARSAHRMNRLIQDLLDVARIERGQLSIACKCEDPRIIAQETFESFRQVAAENERELEAQIDEKLPLVEVDRDRIVQLLSNYLNNAVKFAPKGSCITLSAHATPAGDVQLSVTDAGPGIDPAHHAQVFTRFWQARDTAHLGSGLGLAIAKGIAEAHRGRVWVESIPHQRTTFYVELPRSGNCSP